MNEATMSFAKELVRMKYPRFSDSELEKLAKPVAKDLYEAISEELVLELPEEMAAEIDAWADGDQSREKLEEIVTRSGIDREKITRKILLEYRDNFLKGDENE